MLNFRPIFLLALIPVIALNVSVFGQKFDVVLSQTVKYPKEARDNKIEEVVYVSLDIDQNGELKSYEILQTPNPILIKEVTRSFEIIQKSWKNKLLENRKVNQKYLVILEFNLNADYQEIHSLFKKARQAISSGKNDEAIELLDQCIKLNPYNELYFSTRSNLYREMGKIEESQIDLLRARKLERELLSHMIISGLSV